MIVEFSVYSSLEHAGSRTANKGVSAAKHRENSTFGAERRSQQPEIEVPGLEDLLCHSDCWESREESREVRQVTFDIGLQCLIPRAASYPVFSK